MTMFNMGILSMQNESIFRKKYDEGMHKSEFWEYILEDGIQLISKLPALGAGIYRMRFNKGERLKPDLSLDWSGNFVHLMGMSDKEKIFID